MAHLIDDIARSLATETPRRETLKLILGAFTATFFSSRLSAQTTCSPVCPSGKVCCTTGSKPFCATLPKTCCGNTKCSSTQNCCTTGTSPFCATVGKTCCGNTKCSSTQTCVDNRCVASPH